MQEQVFLKEGQGLPLSHLIFLKFSIFTFRNYFTLWKNVMNLKIDFFFLPP